MDERVEALMRIPVGIITFGIGDAQRTESAVRLSSAGASTIQHVRRFHLLSRLSPGPE